MEPLPLPPPPEPVDVTRMRRPGRAGELTPAWRIVFLIGWAGVILVFAAVWNSGRTLGLSPWWLGPSGDPHNILLNLVPFVPPLAAIAAGLRNMRHLPAIGAVAAIAVAAVAAGDLGRFTGIAVVELAGAAAGLLVSIASLAGMLREVPADDALSTAPTADARDDVVVSSAPVQ